MNFKDKVELSNQFLNENINASKILLINDDGGKTILTKNEALILAKKVGLDLFCVSVQDNLPVCKLLDYKKYLYKLNRKARSQKKNKNIIKEIKISFHIGEGDLQTKIKNITQHLEKEGVMGVKIGLIMKGREREHKDIAIEKCQRILQNLQTHSSSIVLKGDIKLINNIYSFFVHNKN